MNSFDDEAVPDSEVEDATAVNRFSISRPHGGQYVGAITAARENNIRLNQRDDARRWEARQGTERLTERVNNAVAMGRVGCHCVWREICPPDQGAAFWLPPLSNAGVFLRARQ